MTSTDKIREAVELLRDQHNAACFENGDHKDEVDTPWSLGADAIEIALALQARAEKAGAAARESAMQELASLGQAAEAHAAQLKAEAERDALQAEVDRLRAAQAWQPIETAPKDGTWFVIWTHGEPEVGRYNPVKSAKYEPVDGTDFYKKSEFCVYDWDGFNNFGNASHWMPLPTPPTP